MDYQELYEEYKEMTARYCIAVANIEVRLKGGELVIDTNLVDAFYVLAGSFDATYVSGEIAQGEIPLDGIDKEGVWFFEILLIYYRGDENEPSYMETLFIEKTFLSTFEELEEIENNIGKLDINESF